MVNINLTLFIQLGLFLIFLWGTMKFIFIPVIKLLDERDDKIDQDLDAARDDNAKAGELEKGFKRKLSRAKRKAHEEVREAYRKEQREYQAKLLDRRHLAEKEIAERKMDSMKRVEEQRTSYDQLLPGITDEISKRLGVGGQKK